MIEAGAALAPGFTQALIHELLHAESPRAMDAVTVHAADLLGMYDAAARLHEVAFLEETVGGEHRLGTCCQTPRLPSVKGMQCCLASASNGPTCRATCAACLGLLEGHVQGCPYLLKCMHLLWSLAPLFTRLPGSITV